MLKINGDTQTACTYRTGFFFFNDTATTEIYTLSLHDALPICIAERSIIVRGAGESQLIDLMNQCLTRFPQLKVFSLRSEEHTSELQSRQYLVCRLLLEKKLGRR